MNAQPVTFHVPAEPPQMLCNLDCQYYFAQAIQPAPRRHAWRADYDIDKKLLRSALLAGARDGELHAAGSTMLPARREYRRQPSVLARATGRHSSEIERATVLPRAIDRPCDGLSLAAVAR